MCLSILQMHGLCMALYVFQLLCRNISVKFLFSITTNSKNLNSSVVCFLKVDFVANLDLCKHAGFNYLKLQRFVLQTNLISVIK